MQKSLLSQYIMLAKRWAWLIVIGIVICGGGTYIVSKLLRPVYQASTTLIISIQSASSAYDNVNASEQIAPTYAQLLTSSEVLQPVLAQHPGMTLIELRNMVTAKFQSNTALLELDVTNNDPDLAVQLANEIGQSFKSYANTTLPGNVQLVPAERPIDPLWPNPKVYAGIGALVGLGLALALIIIFEWIDDRPGRPEEVEELLGMETLAVVPRLSGKQDIRNAEKVPAFGESLRMLCSGLNAAQAYKPFKLVMITSALPGEGKSTVATKLTSFLKLTGKRVLLVDADLCHPNLDQQVELNHRWGLANVFENMSEHPDRTVEGQNSDVPPPSTSTVGVARFNWTELLQSSIADQVFSYYKRAPFDYVIFDSPPLLPVADARILASHIQATVLVVDASKTSRNVLRRARQTLSRTRGMAIGVVINKSLWSDSGETRRYLSRIRRARKELVMPRLPDTPAVDDEEDATLSAVTVTLRKLDKSEREKISKLDKNGREKS